MKYLSDSSHAFSSTTKYFARSSTWGVAPEKWVDPSVNSMSGSPNRLIELASQFSDLPSHFSVSSTHFSDLANQLEAFATHFSGPSIPLEEQSGSLGTAIFSLNLASDLCAFVSGKATDGVLTKPQRSQRKTPIRCSRFSCRYTLAAIRFRGVDYCLHNVPCTTPLARSSLPEAYLKASRTSPCQAR